MPKIIFKNDKFRKNRGGYSRLFSLSCEKCTKHLFLYQKDGPGILKRLYIDRIIGKQLRGTRLVCRSCRHVLGILTVYKKENRPAYRLFAGAVLKKIVRAV